MTPDDGRPDDDHPLDEASLGEPILELRDLSVEVDARFTSRVRAGIERRLLAGEVLSLAWQAPVTAFFELLRAPFELFGGRKSP